MKNLFNLYDRSKHINFITEILSGLTVSLALVPEAIAFALIAGLSPLTGLYAAFSIGLITSHDNLIAPLESRQAGRKVQSFI